MTSPKKALLEKKVKRSVAKKFSIPCPKLLNPFPIHRNSCERSISSEAVVLGLISSINIKLSANLKNNGGFKSTNIDNFVLFLALHVVKQDFSNGGCGFYWIPPFQETLWVRILCCWIRQPQQLL